MKAPDRLLWYLRRAEGMGANELVFRIGEALLHRVPFMIHRQSPIPLVAPDAHTLADSLIRDADAARRDWWRSAYDDVLNGHLAILGRSRDDVPPEWDLDPGSGERWPKEPAHKLRVTDRPGFGDVKEAWEVNRLQYLIPIACHAYCEQDPVAAQLVATHVKSWLDQDRFGRGVAWKSAIEPALRAISLIVLMELLSGIEGGSSGLTRVVDDLMPPVERSLRQHEAWLLRYPSRFSSANNHRIAELAALVALSCKLSPVGGGTRGGERWDELCRTLAAQIHPDGVGAEQSPTYTAFTLELFLLGHCTARSMGLGVDPPALDLVHKALVVISSLTDEAGGMIRFGDDDEGLALAGALPPAQRQPWLRRLAGLPPEPVRPHGLASHVVGGLSVLRTTDGGGESLWAFDHGPLGMGAIAAHGHADALSLTLHRCGQPVLAEAGTYTYHAGSKWRDHFRSTRAHNTVTIDYRSHSRPTGSFNWALRGRARARLLVSEVGPDGAVSLLAELAAFDDLVHRPLTRRFVRKSDGHYEITDGLELRRPATVTVGFLIHPDVDVEVCEDRWRLTMDEGGAVDVVWPEGAQAVTYFGQEDPLMGWFSPRFGAVVPTYRLEANVIGNGLVSLTTRVICY